MKKFLKSSKAKLLGMFAVISCLAMSVMAVGANALDETVSTALSTGFTTIQTDAITAIALIVPIALLIAGSIFVIRKALTWFKGLAK